MASPEDLKVLDNLKSANYVTLTEKEKDNFRSVDFSDGTLAKAAGELIVSVGEKSMAVDELGKAIYEKAKNVTFTNHGDVKKFLTENGWGGIDKTNVTGYLQAATAAGIDFGFGMGTMIALKAKYSAPIEKPAETVVTKKEEIGTPLLIEEIDSNIVLQDIKTTNLQIDQNCVGCITEGIKDGYVYKKTDTIARVNSLIYNRADSTITMRGNSGEDSLTISVDGLYHTDEKGHGAHFDHDTLASRVIDKLQKHQDKKKEEKQALERDKVAINAAELNKTFDTITKTFDTTMETTSPEKVSQVLTTYSAKKAIGTGGRSAEYGYRQSINTGAKTILSLISQLSTLKQSTADLASDARNTKSILGAKIDKLSAGLQKGYQEMAGTGQALDTYGIDKDDLSTYLNYLQNASAKEMVVSGGYDILLGKGGVFKDIGSLKTRLTNNSKGITKYEGTGAIGKIFQDAYQVGIAMLDTAKADVTKKLDAAANDPANKTAFEAFKTGKQSAA